MLVESETAKKQTYALGKEEVQTILDDLGIFKGMILYVDVNKNHLPYTIGGAQTWISCLMEKVGFEGTIVIPAFSRQTLDPSTLKEVGRNLYPQIRKESNPYDKKLTGVSDKGGFAEEFLKYESVYRSSHPIYSFAAWGKYAKVICEKHPLHFALSKQSPLGKLYDMGAFVLLLGKTYTQTSALHLSRYMDKNALVRVNSAMVRLRNKNQWKEMLEVELSNAEYQIIGELLEKNGVVNTQYLQYGEVKLFSLREIIQLAAKYMSLDEETYLEG